jgi:surface polysaccharide O-acyltransferase-like enzyme
MYAKAEFAIAVLYVILGSFLWMAAPQYMGGRSPADDWSTALLVAPSVIVMIGFAWMIRIYRTSFNPEPDHGGWRYRARGFLRK